MKYHGLDDAFLRYIGATPENQRRIQGFYIPFFADCPGLVVDLACGHGDFVHLLTEQGIEALGVDSDSACCAEATDRGIDVLCSDVFDYLNQVEEESLVGIFSAHLVEHLPYQQVLDLIQLSYRALKPQGIILLTTPNVRALYTHLESFYMHFGHVTFYHPKLLSFFLDYSGFSDPRVGENPRMAHPLWRDRARSDLDDLARPFQENKPPKYKLSSEEKASDLEGFKFWNYPTQTNPAPMVQYNPELESQYPGLLGRAVSAVKMFVVHLVVQPLLDRMAGVVNQHMQAVNHDLAAQWRYLHQINVNVNATHRRLMELDRPVECYVYATKGESNLKLSPELRGKRL
jgi:SAM-dependent methyltransferase